MECLNARLGSQSPLSVIANSSAWPNIGQRIVSFLSHCGTLIGSSAEFSLISLKFPLSSISIGCLGENSGISQTPIAEAWRKSVGCSLFDKQDGRELSVSCTHTVTQQSALFLTLKKMIGDAISGKSELVFVSNFAGIIRLWDISNSTENSCLYSWLCGPNFAAVISESGYSTFSHQIPTISKFSLFKTSVLYAAGIENSNLTVWNLASTKKVLSYSIIDYGIAKCMDLCSQFLVIGCSDGKIIAWEFHNGRNNKVPFCALHSASSICCISIVGKNMMAVGTIDGSVFLADLEKKTSVWGNNNAHFLPITSLTFCKLPESSPEEVQEEASFKTSPNCLVTSSNDCVKLWEIRKGSLLARINAVGIHYCSATYIEGLNSIAISSSLNGCILVYRIHKIIEQQQQQEIPKKKQKSEFEQQSKTLVRVEVKGESIITFPWVISNLNSI